MTNDKKKPPRPRNIANDMLDALETATAKWTRQKKSEERHPGNIRYRVSRMTKEPRTTQKEAAYGVMEEAYIRASGGGRLPAKVRQIFYQARPKIMELTEDKNLDYGYFSQVLVPNYIEENGVDWKVVYDARGHFEEPHTNRRIGCGTIEVGNYLYAMKKPQIDAAEFSEANVDVTGPDGGFGGILYCEKEGFDPLFRSVKLANRYDLMIISNKGVSVTAARQLIDNICGDNNLPLFVLHDFDVAGFMIFGTLQRDTRRYQFANEIEVIDLGLRLADIAGLVREPAAATKTSADLLRAQLAENGASDDEIAILLNERVELNAMTSDALIATIERYEAIKIVLDETQLDALAPCRRPSAASTEHITPFLSTVAERRLNVHAAFWWFCGGLPNTVN
jgi:Topoisomerase 6 subunit A/Spo11, Toprim domain